MKIPSRNTCAHAICKLIYTIGPRHLGQIVSDLGKRFKRKTIEQKVEDLRSQGLLLQSLEGYTLDTRMTRYFDQSETDLRPARPLVKPPAATPRTPPPFRPLRGYSLPLGGMREGAADFRQLPSRHF